MIVRKHTLGPWKLGNTSEDGCSREIDSRRWGSLAEVIVRMQDASLDSEEGVANSILIEAAPTMLDALIKVDEFFIKRFGSNDITMSDKERAVFLEVYKTICKATYVPQATSYEKKGLR